MYVCLYYVLVLFVRGGWYSSCNDTITIYTKTLHIAVSTWNFDRVSTNVQMTRGTIGGEAAICFFGRTRDTSTVNPPLQASGGTPTI